MTLLTRLNPLLSPVVTRMFGTRLPVEEILQPEEREQVRPPALLPGMLDRVSGTDEHSELSYHLSAVHRTVATHAPVLRRTYRNALVRRTGFATLRHNERYGRGRNLGELAGPVLRVPLLRYCHNYVNWRYFGHWLTDAIPSALIDDGKGALWMPPDPSWGHAASYLDVFDMTILEAPVVHADELIVYQDFSQGSSKRARYAILRDRLHARFGGTGGEDCVYLRRGATGAARLIANEADLLDRLTARNWTVIDIASATVAEMQSALCRARVVVSIDGSHLDHAHLSLRQGGTMVVLMPGDKFSTRQIGLCTAHGVSVGMVVLSGRQSGGYHADLDEILRTIDLAGAA